MERFILENDYPTLIRSEVRNLLATSYTDNKLAMAEQMAISQIKNYIKGNYDVELIFTTITPPASDTRNAFIVMITIDCALYHLYSNTAPDRIPEHRSQRYQDALEWLRSVAKGETIADLPTIKDFSSGSVNSIRIKSKYPRTQYRY
jgi:phage gp36-like protein